MISKDVTILAFFQIMLREAAKKCFFSGPATKRGGGGKALVVGPLKKCIFLWLPLLRIRKKFRIAIQTNIKVVFTSKKKNIHI